MQAVVFHAMLLSADRIIAVDQAPSRLEMACAQDAECINFDEIDPIEAIRAFTRRGPLTGVAAAYEALDRRQRGWIEVDLVPGR